MLLPRVSAPCQVADSQPNSSGKLMLLVSLAETLRSWRESLAVLSPATRVFLAVYALSIPVSWAIRYAPGEHFAELESVEPLTRPVVNIVFAQGGRQRAIAADLDHAGWPLLDWTRSEELTPELRPLYSGRIELPLAPSRVLASQAGLQILAWEGGVPIYRRYGASPKATTQKAAPPDALWLRPSGGIVGATTVYERSQRKFGKRPYYESLWHVGRFVVAQAESEHYVQEGTRYVQKPIADDRHFLVFDAESGEPVSELETDMRVNGVYPAPRFDGLLYSTGPELEFLKCDDAGCAIDWVEIATDRSDIRAACYDEKYDRIAVCTGGALFLYQGAPGDEDIVYLGHGSLEQPCDKVWIADEATLLLALVDDFYAVARFRWIH